MELASGELHGNGDGQVAAVAELDRAAAGDIVFVVDQKRLASLEGCAASVAIVPADVAAAAHAEYGMPTIGVADPIPHRSIQFLAPTEAEYAIERNRTYPI